VGITLISEAPFPVTGAEASAIPGTDFRVPASRVNAAASAREVIVPTSCSGAGMATARTWPRARRRAQPGQRSCRSRCGAAWWRSKG
jgi:hypothetical protein